MRSVLQNRLNIGTDKPKLKLKVKMQSVSDDDVRKSHYRGARTSGSRDECRTAPDGRRPLDQTLGLEPLVRL